MAPNTSFYCFLGLQSHSSTRVERSGYLSASEKHTKIAISKTSFLKPKSKAKKKLSTILEASAIDQVQNLSKRGKVDFEALAKSFEKSSNLTKVSIFFFK